ncbi:hypothetical protein BU26DRAFT_555589 [Trematosphaeria pertusa]|uniref:Protein kinase domain-containing protein n=1 Tax=Trematosphaeria pertusa TaxID=390896 RepID=A0A6A6HXB3_9PLEO|nr:uncharacterized protein BU26DRAFT_555589 [Trematosphaeria pertusa]KAF2242362.1 hypothetical protein BU26DRAFT_555589 [Trematosphaeria pertusa]
MDLFSTSLEIIHLVYTTTIFIRDVTQEVKGYGDAKRDISERLEHELVFVETFSDVCFGEERGFLRDTRVRDSVKRDVKHCLDALNKALAAYRAEAWKYAGAVPDLVDQSAEDLTKLELKDEGKKKWRDGMKARCQVWRKKAAPLEWALFGKEEMEALLVAYSEWTDRLRQTLSIILLLVGTPTLEFAASAQAANLGVKEVSERQARVVSKPPEEYDALQGEMKNPVVAKPGNGLIRGVYEDESGFDSVDVVVEIRPYEEALSLAVSERNYDEARELKEPLRQLTWLLQSPMDSNVSTQDAAEGYRMHTLSCMGFLDEPSKNRSLILYRAPQTLPAAQDVPTLHTYVQKGAKPALGSRFLTARALAATLLTIHTSDWVHKNICSRSVLILPISEHATETLPYLVGWDVARPLEAGTSLHALFDLEPNLYRHQQRFGKPSQKFANEHDIYSLGVVLLEIGLWKAMSTIFARPLEKNPRIETTQQHALFKRVNGMIVDMAQGIELKREMGERYAAVVQKCLKWEPSQGQEEVVESSIRFRTEVVDALVAGCKL